MAQDAPFLMFSDLRKRSRSGACATAEPQEERKTMTDPPSRPGQRKPLDAGPFGLLIGSFGLHLAAEGKAAKTVRTYTDAVAWFAAAHLLSETTKTGWEQVDGRDVQCWLVYLLGRSTGGTPRFLRCSRPPGSGQGNWPGSGTPRMSPGAVTSTCGSVRSPSGARAAGSGSSGSATRLPGRWTGMSGSGQSTRRRTGPSCGSGWATADR